jgi:hypothetical protein
LLGDHGIYAYTLEPQTVFTLAPTPERLSDEQRRLLAEFDAASDDDTYRHDESFFEKLKSAFR